MVEQYTRAMVVRHAATDAAQIASALVAEDRPLPPVSVGEVRIRAIYLSLDPAQIMWIAMRSPYMPIRPGDVLPCSQIGIVEESKIDGIEAGDVVTCFANMAERSVVCALGVEHRAGTGGTLAVTRIDRDPRIPLDLHLSLFSHIGVTAISGMKLVARVRPGETVLVSGAAGATGSIAAQLAKAYGARVIGIAGGPAKCEFLTNELGLDGAIDHRTDVDAQLTRLVPEGANVFFDNIGGSLLDAVLMHMAPRGRIIICGSTADYGLAPEDRYRLANIGQLLQRNVSMTPFWVSDYDAALGENMAELRRRYLDGSLKVRPSHVVQGLDAIAEALGFLLSGKNEGKLMAQVAPVPD